MSDIDIIIASQSVDIEAEGTVASYVGTVTDTDDWRTTWTFELLYYLAAYTATGNLEILIDGTNATVNGGTFATITLDGTQSLTFRGDGIVYTLGGDMTENGETLAAGTYTVVALWGNDSVSISVALVNQSGTLALANTPPVASAVTISGTVAVGQTLTGSYTYTDADGDTESGSTFVWQRSDDGSTGWANISAATATTYEVQSADEGKYLRFGVTPSDGTDSGTQAFSAATIQVPDATAPTFSNVSVSDVTGTTANFNAQINEAGTIFWAVFPTATAQQTDTVIEAGTGAVDFGSISTAGSTIETDAITGLDDETAYKVHYFGRDTAGNESTATLTSEFSTGDATAPTLTAASIENATPSQLDLTFDEATTITTAGWSMSASGGAVTIDSVVSGSGTTTPKLGLSRSIANGETVTISYDPATGNTTDANSNELAAITNQAVTNNVAGSIIIFSDNFTGTTPNATNWPTRNNTAGLIEQNDKFINKCNVNSIGSLSALGNAWISKEIQGNLLVLKFDFEEDRSSDNEGMFVGLNKYGETNSNGDAVWFLLASASNDWRKIIRKDGVAVNDNFTGIASENNSFKIIFNNTLQSVSYYRWNGSTWVELGSTYSVDFTDVNSWSVFISVGTGGSATTRTGTMRIDNLHVTNQDFSTLNPE